MTPSKPRVIDALLGASTAALPLFVKHTEEQGASTAALQLFVKYAEKQGGSEPQNNAFTIGQPSVELGQLLISPAVVSQIPHMHAQHAHARVHVHAHVHVWSVRSVRSLYTHLQSRNN